MKSLAETQANDPDVSQIETIAQMNPQALWRAKLCDAALVIYHHGLTGVRPLSPMNHLEGRALRRRFKQQYSSSGSLGSTRLVEM